MASSRQCHKLSKSNKFLIIYVNLVSIAVCQPFLHFMIDNYLIIGVFFHIANSSFQSKSKHHTTRVIQLKKQNPFFAFQLNWSLLHYQTSMQNVH